MGLLRPSASSLASKDDQARATVLARQLGVSAFLGAACLVESSPVSGGTLSPWGSIGSDGTDQGRVDGQLGTVEERQTICNHFEATVIQLASWQEVEVLDSDIGGHRSSLSADARGTNLQGKLPTSEHPDVARCSVVATEVKWLATPAEGGREGERAPEAAQEKDAKTLRVQTRRG